jgi:NAD(P)H-dependent flavin oxidoreductase YrpB (nitropropane dioxygenase family)
MLKTRLTTLLGIRYPIISAPMALASGGGLATAVSAAGALGTFGAVNPWGAIGTDYVQEQIRHIRSRTDRPFGVGFITQAIQGAPKNLDAVLDEAVRVIIFSFAVSRHEWPALDGVLFNRSGAGRLRAPRRRRPVRTEPPVTFPTPRMRRLHL